VAAGCTQAAETLVNALLAPVSAYPAQLLLVTMVCILLCLSTMDGLPRWLTGPPGTHPPDPNAAGEAAAG
jgi:hypothetical protein